MVKLRVKLRLNTRKDGGAVSLERWWMRRGRQGECLLLYPESTAVEEEDDKKPILNITVNPKHQSLAWPAIRPLMLGNWMFNIVADLTKPVAFSVPAPDMNVKRDARRINLFMPIAPEAFTGVDNEIGLVHGRRPSSIQVLPHPPTLGIAVWQSAHTTASRRHSLHFTQTSPTASSFLNRSTSKTAVILPGRQTKSGKLFGGKRRTI
jgi:ATP-binding cassette subfamily B (MDR/TAP) protein 1